VGHYDDDDGEIVSLSRIRWDRGDRYATMIDVSGSSSMRSDANLLLDQRCIFTSWVEARAHRTLVILEEMTRDIGSGARICHDGSSNRRLQALRRKASSSERKHCCQSELDTK